MHARSTQPIPPLRADNIVDRSVLERLRNGEDSALVLVIACYQGVLFRYVANMIHVSEMAEDILQEVFIHLWNTRSRINPDLPIRPYLYRIARNLTLDALASTTARERRETQADHDRGQLVESPASILEAEELDVEIQRAIEALPPRCQEIFVLVRASGLTYAEVSNLLGVSVSTVKTQMGRAMTMLAERLLPLLSSLVLVAWRASA